MAYIYRYIDLADEIVKYVGIVWGESRTLQQRLNEHEKYDKWCYTRRWKIQYIETGINNRTEAEFFESHFISLYNTDKYFNNAKSNWGVSCLVPFVEQDWKEYIQVIKSKEEIDIEKASKRIVRLEKKITKLLEDISRYRQLKKLEFDAYFSIKQENIKIERDDLLKLQEQINDILQFKKWFVQKIKEQIQFEEDWAESVSTQVSKNRHIDRMEGLQRALSLLNKFDWNYKDTNIIRLVSKKLQEYDNN